MNYKLRINLQFTTITSYIVHLTLCLLLFTGATYAQQKENQNESKNKKTTVVNGTKYYLHTVEKGQTLFAIARLYDRTVNDIVIENPEAIDGIKPGQVLKIPVEKTKPKEKEIVKNETIDSSKFIFHKVEAGQTFFSIAKKYSTTVDKLKSLNPDLTDGLKIGQTIKVSEKKSEKSISVKQSPVKKEVKTETETKPISKKEEVEEKEKPTSVEYVGNLKDEYNVAFFLPFHSDEANAMEIEKLIKGEEQFSNKTTIALQFYEGAMIAIDSLKKQKLNAKIMVYDIDDKDSLNIEKILQKPELKQMDLFIGPLYGSSFIPFAKFAKSHNIPIVAPFMQVNKILFNNPYVCKLSPSSTLQVEQIANYVVDTFQTQNIILVDYGNAKEISFVNAFKNTANEKLQLKNNDTIKIAKSLSLVQADLSATKTNVVVLPSNSQSYVTEFVRGLNVSHEKYKIALFGMQSWVNFDNMDFDYLNNLNTHLPINNFVDYGNESTKLFIKKYREQYKTEPEMYSYQGFDVAYYFLSALQKNGTGFLNSISKNDFKGIENNYQFKQFPSDSGFENKFVFIIKYKDYKLVKAN